jgi:hypothetical protein
LITVGFITGAKSFESEMPPAVACTSISADDLLECDALWNLTATTMNSDAARVAVDALSDTQDIRGCDAFVAASTGLWTENWRNWTDGAASGATVLPAYLNTPTHQCAAKVCHGCYCQAQGFSAWAEDAKQLSSYCDIFWDNYIKQVRDAGDACRCLPCVTVTR